jgi:hypothetical protein
MQPISCGRLRNRADVKGCFLLMQRGECNFAEKAKRGKGQRRGDVHTRSSWCGWYHGVWWR